MIKAILVALSILTLTAEIKYLPRRAERVAASARIETIINSNKHTIFYPFHNPTNCSYQISRREGTNFVLLVSSTNNPLVYTNDSVLTNIILRFSAIINNKPQPIIEVPCKTNEGIVNFSFIK